MIWEVIGSGRLKIEAMATLCGKDLVILLQGGETHHIGALALATPRPSLANPDNLSASASILCVNGHKEDELARAMALKAATTLNRTTTVIAGIHVDNASEEDIEDLLRNCEIAIATLIGRIKG